LFLQVWKRKNSSDPETNTTGDYSSPEVATKDYTTPTPCADDTVLCPDAGITKKVWPQNHDGWDQDFIYNQEPETAFSTAEWCCIWVYTLHPQGRLTFCTNQKDLESLCQELAVALDSSYLTKK
jgi:hypothetical protein